MNCLRCGNPVNKNDGYETEDGQFIHHGCAMFLDEMPRKKVAHSLADLLAAKKKVDAINARDDARRRGM